jgi:O-methyltransferase involved in polyketide biosynthesis
MEINPFGALRESPVTDAVPPDPIALRQPPAGVDTTVPHSARTWNYWLGGKDNFPVDREAGDRFRDVYPQIVEAARESRYFLARAVRYLAAEADVRQFLDVGTGLPTVDNTHEVAQRVAPESRIVYVDNDPLVLSHTRALLAGSPVGAISYLEADLRDPDTILRGAAKTLDFTRPVALILNGVMGHVSADDDAYSIVDRLLSALPPGSHLSLSDGIDIVREGAADRAVEDSAHAEAIRRYNESGAVPYHLRSPERIARLFDGLTLVEPGLVSYAQWRPEPSSPAPVKVQGLCGVGRKD